MFALAAIGLNIHFGYTGLLNFGQVGFMPSAPTRIAIGVDDLGCRSGCASSSASSRPSVLRSCSASRRCGCAPTTWPSSPSPPAEIIRLVRPVAALRGLTGGAAGIQDFADAFYDLNPFSATARYGFGPVRLLHGVNSCGSRLVGWALVALVLAVLVCLLIRSPWGRVLEGHPRGRGRGPQPRQERLPYKMQALIIGGVIGALGGMVFAIGRQSVAARQPRHGAHLLRLHRAASSVAPHGLRTGARHDALLLRPASSSSSRRYARLPRRPSSTVLAATEVGIVHRSSASALMLLMIFRPQGIFGDKGRCGQCLSRP